MKIFFAAALAFMLVVGLSPKLARSQEQASRDSQPNVLWIIAEDMGPELEFLGTKQVKTPTLNKLAERGMTYRNAFTVTPVCSTSRSSFVTGMYAMAIGAHNHRSNRDRDFPLPDGVRVITDWFRPHGYSTANIVRLTDDQSLHPFFKGTGKTDWNFTYGDGKPFDLRNWKDLKDHQPFYAQVNLSETHRGKDWNQAHQHVEDPADPEQVEIPQYYPDHAVTRAVWAQYLNAVMAVDKKVEFILKKLEDDGMSDNTIVVFMGDHGRAMPRGKQWPYDSGLHIPLIIYIPESLSSAVDGYEAGTVTEELVLSIDVTATSLALAGIDKPEKMQGNVILGSQRDPAREVLFGGRDRGDETVFHIRTARDKQFRYLKNKYPERPFLQINRYKESSYPIIGLMRYLHARNELTGPPLVLMAESRSEEELYDLENDPWEINNLADDPEYGDVKRRLSMALANWQDEIDDQGRTPEPQELLDAIEADFAKKYGPQLNDRPEDWFFNAPGLGPYRVTKPDADR